MWIELRTGKRVAGNEGRKEGRSTWFSCWQIFKKFINQVICGKHFGEHKKTINTQKSFPQI